MSVFFKIVFDTFDFLLFFLIFLSFLKNDFSIFTICLIFFTNYSTIAINKIALLWQFRLNYRSAASSKRLEITTMIWHSESIENIITEFKTDPERGISPGEAEERRGVFGSNIIAPKKQKSFLSRFAKKLRNYTTVVLFAAAVVSLLTIIISNKGSLFEPLVIMLIVIINALLGAARESKTAATLNALEEKAAPSARVVRSGALQTIPANELVPGDIISLETGDYIPADARLIEASTLRCNESTLTGETVDVEKMTIGPEIPDIAPVNERYNMVYAGCSVTSGFGKAVVTSTGFNTEKGKNVTIVKTANSGSQSLKSGFESLTKALGITVSVICAIIFLIGFIEGPSAGQTYPEKIVEMFVTAVSLAAASIPAGLSSIITVILALGIKKLFDNNATVRNPSTVKSLCDVSVICTDKTGTLTQNKMELTAVFDGNRILELNPDEIGAAAKALIRLGAICCDVSLKAKNGREIPVGDPAEIAITKAAVKCLSVNKEALDNEYPRVASLPFDPDRRLMTTVNMIDGKFYAVVKGAPDVLLSKCTSGNIKAAVEANDEMGKSALRVLAVGIKPLDAPPANANSEILENGLTFVGLLGFFDPPKTDAARSVALCSEAGIRTVMITGDHITTASAIARQLGILRDGTTAVSGEELAKMSDEELCRDIKNITVFARVSPDDKLRIVEALKRAGFTVAITGNGVKDAAALEKADVGCAMGIRGTDVAKGAASVIINDDSFSTIANSVKESKGIYSNIEKCMTYILGNNLAQIFVALIGFIIFKFSPLASIQILFAGLILNSAAASALGREPAEYDAMDGRSTAKRKGIISKETSLNALRHGLILTVLTLIAFALGKSGDGNVSAAHSMAFAVLTFGGVLSSFGMRSKHFIFRIGLLKNQKLLWAILFSAAVTILAMLTPLKTVFGITALDGSQWLEIVLLSFATLAIGELIKLGQFIYKKFKKS